MVDNIFTTIMTVICTIVLIAITIFIGPWLLFWLAYFGGWIAKIIIGKWLVAGFALLNIDLPLDKIPLLAGTLGWIGGFFLRTINYNKK